MNLKTHLCQGVDANRQLRILYHGQDAGAAKAAYESALNGEHEGIVHAQLFLGLRPDRRKDVSPGAKASAAAVKRARAEQAENDRKAAEAAAKAKADSQTKAQSLKASVAALLQTCAEKTGTDAGQLVAQAKAETKAAKAKAAQAKAAKA